LETGKHEYVSEAIPLNVRLCPSTWIITKSTSGGLTSFPKKRENTKPWAGSLKAFSLEQKRRQTDNAYFHLAYKYSLEKQS